MPQRRIEIVAVDDQCSPTAAVAAAGELLDANVVAIVGHVCSGATGEALPLYESRGLPVISPSSTNPTLTDGTYPYFFRTIQPDTAITQTMVDLLVGEGASNLYIIRDSRSDYWSDADVDRVVTQIGASATHLGTLSPDFSADLSSAASTISGSSADGVLIFPGIATDAAQSAADVVDAIGAADFSGTSFEEYAP